MAELFWDTFHHKGYQLPTDSRCCYMFEMTSMANVIVVRWVHSTRSCVQSNHVSSALLITYFEVLPWKYII
jgi:hypothetical protein